MSGGGSRSWVGFAVGKTHARVTVSVGVATLHGSPGHCSEELVAPATARLEAGRSV